MCPYSGSGFAGRQALGIAHLSLRRALPPRRCVPLTWLLVLLVAGYLHFVFSARTHTFLQDHASTQSFQGYAKVVDAACNTASCEAQGGIKKPLFYSLLKPYLFAFRFSVICIAICILDAQTLPRSNTDPSHLRAELFSNDLHIHKIVSLPRAPQPIEPLVRGFDALLLSCTLD